MFISVKLEEFRIRGSTVESGKDLEILHGYQLEMIKNIFES